jgi:hypothetical protein
MVRAEVNVRTRLLDVAAFVVFVLAAMIVAFFTSARADAKAFSAPAAQTQMEPAFDVSGPCEIKICSINS